MELPYLGISVTKSWFCSSNSNGYPNRKTRPSVRENASSREVQISSRSRIKWTFKKKKLPNCFIMGTTKTSEEFLTTYFKKIVVRLATENNFKFCSYLVLRSFSFSNSFLFDWLAKKCPVAKLTAFLPSWEISITLTLPQTVIQNTNLDG